MALHSILKTYCRRLAGLFLLLPVLLLAEDGQSAHFNVTLDFDSQLLDGLIIELLCNSGEPQRQQIRLAVAGSTRLELWRFKNNNTICQLHALLEDGYSAEYQSQSDGGHRANEHGCHFTTVSHDHNNECLIEISQNTVPVTVYKKWVGASGKEPSVEISLECDGRAISGPRHINEKSPRGWDVANIHVNGSSCDVFETVDDTFVADQSDCRGVMLFPGRGAECTMVNTKVVKRIEMLNRYGKAIMIIVMLVAGLVAVRRYV
ncbi:hypothetical protein ACFL1V_08495 [Pseudomonadota bacterium]